MQRCFWCCLYCSQMST